MIKIKRNVLILFLFTCLLAAQPKQKIIFDCDVGGDVDDAYAIALLLTSPEFDILGIVMDSGDTPRRAQVACRLLYETGREEIPVIVGRKTWDNYDNQFHWAEGFDKLKPSPGNAADFILKNLRKYPGEIILFTVGPVSNIADILKKDPQALKLTKRVVSMFGSFYMGYDGGAKTDAEWNVKADIAASQIFVNCGADLTFAGLDITTFVRFNQQQLLKILMRQSPLTNALSGLYQLWQYESYAQLEPTLFDVVVVGMVLWPELFKTKEVHVAVTDSGFTEILPHKKANIKIGVTIQKDEFVQRVIDRLIKQNLGRKSGSAHENRSHR